MHSEPDRQPILFANSGVQCVCLPLGTELHFSVEQVGYGWQHCQCKVADAVTEFGYIQWQIVPGQNKLLLAIDTTVGKDDQVGYFSKESSLGGDFEQVLTNLLGVNGETLRGLPPIGFIIRPATAEGGKPRDVHMVVDFGNSRTGALLVEFRATTQEPLMHPLQLIHRYNLDAWDDDGELTRSDAAWWFSSKTHWCTAPYLEPRKVEKVVYEEEEKRKGLWIGGGKKKPQPRSTFETPATFEDLSMVRMGREADDLSMIMRTDGEVRTGVSSPKRYLWAKDASWLEGANWHMADPAGRHNKDDHATTLKGPFLRFFPEDDKPDDPRPEFEVAPPKPCHAPRILMVAALYEMLCQAYTYINSPSYRRSTGDAARMRQLRSLTLTYPSGMIGVEREQFKTQAQKAIRIFTQTLGKQQEVEPDLKLSVDEASAVHLTYIWSEVQKLGRKPSLWFSLMCRDRGEAAAGEEAPEQPDEVPPASGPGGRRPSRPTRSGRGRGRTTRGPEPEAPKGGDSELRIACIDIGGGTSDLMIAKYVCERKIGGDRIHGETLHRDGISLAGDHLVKRLLEKIIVPALADAIGLESHDAFRLFGPEVPGYNSEFRAQRIHWINHLLVPLAQALLDNAVDEVEDEISHTDVDIVAPEARDSFQNTINRIFGAGVYNVNQELGLRYDRDEFEDIVHEVFDDLIFDFCESIVEHKADVVLLAGQPTKLRYIRELVETYLPLSQSRIIPMYGRYVGTWYPYQNPDSMNPGVIVDPKSAVVVGAAIEFSARHGMLSQFQFRMSDEAAKRSYYWGVMAESRIYDERIVFHHRPAEEGPAKAEKSEPFDVHDQRLIIGRKRRASENAQASPVYLLHVDTGDRIGEINVRVGLERNVGGNGEEQLEIVSVQGEVAGEEAVLGENIHFDWRTLADERYYLDTGGLDKIDLE